jgi:hypothetical protein
MNENDNPRVFDAYEPLRCVVRPSFAIVAAVYAACKGICDRAVSSVYNDRGYTTSWEDLEDLIHPQGFMRWDKALMNEPYGKGYYRVTYSPEAYETLQEIKLKIFQKVLRQPTPEEREKFLEDQWWRDNIGPL